MGSVRSSAPSPPLCASMVPSTSISLSSRPTWCPTPVSTSLWLHTPPSSPPRRLTMSSSQLLRSPTLASRSESTTSHPLLFLVVILPRSSAPCACCPTPLPLLRLGLVLTTSSISCTPNVPSFTGTSERAWKRESSLRLVKILLPLRRTTRRSESTVLKERLKRRARSIKHSLRLT